MKILLKKILEKLIMVLFVFVILFGNLLIVYNIVNKYKPLNEVVDISAIITDSKNIVVKDIVNDNSFDFNTPENQDKLKEIFDNVKIRESKLNILDKEQKVEYTIFIIDKNGNEIFINVYNSEIMINDSVYICDFKINKFFTDLIKNLDDNH